MNIKDINNLDLSTLKILLKNVKKYKELRNKLWKRGEELFNLSINNKSKYLVEYYWKIDQKELFTLSKKIYKESFWEEPSESEILFERNDAIKWWLKVYKDDFVADLSFSKIEKQIR